MGVWCFAPHTQKTGFFNFQMGAKSIDFTIGRFEANFPLNRLTGGGEACRLNPDIYGIENPIFR